MFPIVQSALMNFKRIFELIRLFHSVKNYLEIDIIGNWPIQGLLKWFFNLFSA